MRQQAMKFEFAALIALANLYLYLWEPFLGWWVHLYLECILKPGELESKKLIKMLPTSAQLFVICICISGPEYLVCPIVSRSFSFTF